MTHPDHRLTAGLDRFLIVGRCGCGQWEAVQVGPDDGPPSAVLRRIQEQHRQHVIDATGGVEWPTEEVAAGDRA